MNDFVKDLLTTLLPLMLALFAWRTTGMSQKEKERQEASRQEWKDLYERQEKIIARKDDELNKMQGEINALKLEVKQLENEMKELQKWK